MGHIKKRKVSDPAKYLHFPGPNFKDSLKDKTIKPHKPSPAELEELEHLIINLSYYLEQLIVKFQFLESFDLPKSLETEKDEITKTLMKRYRVQFPALLVKQYFKEGIPILDDILFLRRSHNIFHLPDSLGSGIFKIENVDLLGDSIIQTAKETVESWKKRVRGDQMFMDEAEKGIKNLNCGSEPETKWPPKLPEIKNKKIKVQIFTHKSTLTEKGALASREANKVHNERFEFKGDSIISFVIGELLYDSFPDDSVGDLSKKKSSLVCNDTLFDFAVAYDFHKKLKISADLRKQIFINEEKMVVNSETKNKAIADVFEAYVGGLAVDRGLKVVSEWLKVLYDPFIVNMTEDKNSKREVDMNAKNILYNKVGSKNNKIVYVQLTSKQPFRVECIINGEKVSEGEGTNVKVASNQAAMNVLDRPDIVEYHAEIRRKTEKTAKDTAKV